MQGSKERIEISLTAREKRLLQRAQLLSGELDFADYLVCVLKQHAHSVAKKHSGMVLSETDRELFFKSLFQDAVPNESLTKAVSQYKKRIRAGWT